MRRLINEFQRFGRDEGGAFAVLFGIMAIVLIATAGAVVDFTSLEQARTRSQTALDAAALALQPQIYTLPAGTRDATLKGYAQEILNERLADNTITATVATVTSNTVDGTLKLNATVTKGTSFVGLIGIPNITAKLVSEATRRQLDLEVAMVLDNSISMDTSSRMTNLKKAARCATNVLLNSIASCTDAALTAADALAATVPNTKIAIVPFTEFVNIGNSASIKTAAWMDKTGASKVSKDNFDNDDYDGNGGITSFPSPIASRFDLYTRIGVTWSGCVEARNHTTGTDGLYYDTSDLPANPTIGDSLFSPVFAPDQPDAGGYANNYLKDLPTVTSTCKKAPTWSWQQDKATCNKDANSNSPSKQSNYDNATCTGSTTNTYAQKDQTGATVSPAATTQPVTLFNNPSTCTTTYSRTGTSGSGSNTKYNNRRVISCTYDYSDRELQERLCKYVSGNTVTLSSNFQAGPNADCGQTLVPLTNTKSTLISKITAMGADGGTNIHQGVMWGFHVLTPTAPFSEGKAMGGSTSKVLILMTDGENTASSQGMNAGTAGNTITAWAGGEWYLAYGFPYSRRLDTAGVQGTTWSALQTEMDNRTKATCANAKAAGITVYTIGLATSTTSNPTAVTAMLRNCATDFDHAYFPASATDLVDTFKAIASQLADLRLAK